MPYHVCLLWLHEAEITYNDLNFDLKRVMSFWQLFIHSPN